MVLFSRRSRVSLVTVIGLLAPGMTAVAGVRAITGINLASTACPDWVSEAPSTCEVCTAEPPATGPPPCRPRYTPISQGGTLPSGREHEKSGSQLSDCNRPHKGLLLEAASRGNLPLIWPRVDDRIAVVLPPTMLGSPAETRHRIGVNPSRHAARPPAGCAPWCAGRRWAATLVMQSARMQDKGIGDGDARGR
jgi:hypothetical protein